MTVLSSAETRVAESLLASALGTQVAIRAAETILDRSHILRLHLADSGSVVFKRRREDADDLPLSFGAELIALEFLNGMPTAVAPRLLAADAEAEILIMEDLGHGSSLAHSLLASDREHARADLVAYARALAAMHSWSIGRSREFAEVQERRDPGAEHAPHWLAAITGGKEAFLAAVGRLGLSGGACGAVGAVGEEIDSLPELLRGAGMGLVHSDACPDNTRIVGGTCRIFDFETSGWGPVALDAAYLLAPFPSCWCFASLPADIAGPAISAYRDQMARAGIGTGADWDTAMTAALAGWVVARGAALGQALDEDTDWGTTTARPRILTWLRSFADAADQSGVLPRLHSLAVQVHEQLSRRWPEAVVPGYPALARPGAVLARIPAWWEPSS